MVCSYCLKLICHFQTSFSQTNKVKKDFPHCYKRLTKLQSKKKPQPQIVEELNILNEFKVTLSSKNFLLYYTYNESNRILIFLTNANLQILQESTD